MQKDALELTVTLPIPPDEVYKAWLDSSEHAAMTGSAAQCEAKLGGRFTCWSGYISGSNLYLEPGCRIVQAWRTKDFSADDPDSRLDLRLSAVPEGTRIKLKHTELPAGQGARYEKGWHEKYLEPMQRYFTEKKRER